MQMQEAFDELFFKVDRKTAVETFVRSFTDFMGTDNCPTWEEVRNLHMLGYLPLNIWAVPEGSAVDHRVPVMTVYNTETEDGNNYRWLPGFIETWYSAAMWHACTSASTAMKYRQVFDLFADQTSDIEWFTDFQGHDFSMRGLPGIFAAGPSGAGHLASFKGTDTILAVRFVQYYYPGDNGLIGTSVPATEHSVTQAGGQSDELATIRRIITEVHPAGIVSVVADTWDFWKFITEIIATLKPEIMARPDIGVMPGRTVVRPDSSPKTPVEIIVGDPTAAPGTPEFKGAIELLWEIFGGTVNSKGFKQLDDHIGLIYGDAISLETQWNILEGLKNKGFASTNVVLGIGSYTYQCVTRDTHGQALKETLVKKGGQWVPTFKDPVTDTSGKKSARGGLSVHRNEDGSYYYAEHPTLEAAQAANHNVLRPVWTDGEFKTKVSFSEVRRVAEEHRPWI